MWQITKIISEHNHDMDPSMSRFMDGHGKITPNMKRVLEANDICGIRPCKSIRMPEVKVSGLENLSCMPKDCRNFIQSKRGLRLEEGDVEAIRRAMYEEFHNVVSFNTTYLVNRYKMPFATVVGVNHHGQSILLVLEKFRNITDYGNAINEFKALIYDSLSIEMFKNNWMNFVSKYGMERND
ncbi:hypothetical protein GH714_041560 [Hevea brasiliensis]|uniref:Uncharacterized protein n=1 Tax=Hevea brasiliensis TaxID=3981 RepID=A0A6A6MWA8_HEVBR|nr:hypothetical protein GH714_041560 [Hevea brasiliensis]